MTASITDPQISETVGDFMGIRVIRVHPKKLTHINCSPVEILQTSNGSIDTCFSLGEHHIRMFP
jgi:hypothetical protein